MTNYYREPPPPDPPSTVTGPAPVKGASQRLEETVRARIVKLTDAGAHVCRNGPQDQELRRQLALLRSLDPAFAARARALAGLPPKQTRPTNSAGRRTPPASKAVVRTKPPEPTPVRWTGPATYRTADEVIYNTAYHPRDWR